MSDKHDHNVFGKAVRLYEFEAKLIRIPVAITFCC